MCFIIAPPNQPLYDLLNRLRHGIEITDIEDAMHEFTERLLDTRNKIITPTTTSTTSSSEIESIFKGDESLLYDLHHNHDAVSVLLDSILWNIGRGSPEFNNNACIALMHFAFQNKERSLYIYENGGISILMSLMESYHSLDYIQIICIALMMVIGKNIGFHHFFLEYPILNHLIMAMEHHSQSHHVYTVACSAMATLLGYGRNAFYFALFCDDDDDDNNNQVFGMLYNRALSCICFGLVIHQDYSAASETGRVLLCNLVGPAVAEEMVYVWEREHMNASYIAAAAA